MLMKLPKGKSVHLECRENGKILCVAESIIVTAQSTKTLWAVMCLSYDTENADAPATMTLDGLTVVLVAWAKDKKFDYPIYLQVTDMSRSKQKFMMATAFQALKEKGYALQGA
jgi:hypothetical protein